MEMKVIWARDGESVSAGSVCHRPHRQPVHGKPRHHPSVGQSDTKAPEVLHTLASESSSIDREQPLTMTVFKTVLAELSSGRDCSVDFT